MNKDHTRDHAELKHILFIMDGNGRWATRQGLPREEGHRAASFHITDILYECVKHGIKYITLFGFSTENLKRPQKEIDSITNTLADCVSNHMLDWHTHGLQIRHIGKLDHLDPEKREMIRSVVELTKNNTEAIVTAAVVYGARDDIVSAIRQIVRDGIDPDHITEEKFASYLSSAGMPDPDLVIRTGGRLRISNIFLWELSYSELWFTDILWPDFRPEHLREAINDFHTRVRTFGMVPEFSKEKFR
jgi:undecaprenyl diphosphate synthase